MDNPTESEPAFDEFNVVLNNDTDKVIGVLKIDHEIIDQISKSGKTPHRYMFGFTYTIMGKDKVIDYVSMGLKPESWNKPKGKE